MKKFLFIILTVFSFHAQAWTTPGAQTSLHQINEWRQQAGLPALSGQLNSDMFVLKGECLEQGNQGSCQLLQRLQWNIRQYQARQQQQLWNSMMPQSSVGSYGGGHSSAPSSGYSDSYLQQAQECNAQPDKVWMGFACRDLSRYRIDF